MAEVVFREATKRFGTTTALHALDLAVHDGELLVLLGPSGCGKTTALRLVAGLEEPDEGEIVIGDAVVNDIEPKDRDVAMVFQSYALYPHLTVRQNIEFPLRQRGVGAGARRKIAKEAADSLQLGDLLDRKPRQLSGGQRQRVALARAVVREPQVFLMDEPLSNLDAELRLHTRADIVTLQRRLGTTTLYVTHDQVEAMTMGQRIAVMHRGELQQVDPPQTVYDLPANMFVAQFVGSPGMNLLPVRSTMGSPPRVLVPGGTMPLGAVLLAPASRVSSLVAGVRPEHLSLTPEGTIEATVVIVELLGAEAHVLCELADGTKIVVRQGPDHVRPAPAECVRLSIAPGAVHLFRADSGARLEPT